MAKLAFMTIGALREPMAHPDSQGFVDRIPAVFESVANSPGIVGFSRFDPETKTHTWGERVLPEHFAEFSDPTQVPSTLSLWEDIESVAAFAYRGAHGEAMSRRHEWFLPDESSAYVAWWVDDEHIPSYAEGSERWTRMHEAGPTADAFNFKEPFDPEGNPTRLDNAIIREKALHIR